MPTLAGSQKSLQATDLNQFILGYESEFEAPDWFGLERPERSVAAKHWIWNAIPGNVPNRTLRLVEERLLAGHGDAVAIHLELQQAAGDVQHFGRPGLVAGRAR